ncbi:MAG: M20/M25/M40 family metallo-hydrolase [Candidatus Njordarchaeales archaeon]
MSYEDIRAIRDFLYNLISIRTVSGEESAGIKFLVRVFSELGISEIATQFVTEDSLNLIINATKSPDLAIIAHIDTIPPLVPARILDEYTVAGTGAVDDKGSIAAIYYIFYKNFELPSNVSIAIVSNEENTGSGCLKYLESYHPKRALVLEPTDLRLSLSSTGFVEILFTISGVKRHPDFFVLVDNYEEKEDPVRRAIRLLNDLSIELQKIKAKFSITYISAGDKDLRFTTPDSCRLVVNIPIQPGFTVSEVLKIIKHISMKHKVHYEVLDLSDPHTMNDSAFLQILKKSYKEVFRKDPEIFVLPSWTDATTLMEKGVPAAIFGPGKPEIAHTVFEKVDVRDIIQAGKYLMALLDYIRK